MCNFGTCILWNKLEIIIPWLPRQRKCALGIYNKGKLKIGQKHGGIGWRKKKARGEV